MRLLSLDGRQVGHWIGSTRLQLQLSSRLTVVLGDNEAGKSTLRRAIQALLFGPDPTLVAPINVAQFNLAAEVAHDGVTATLHRRGRKLQESIPDTLATLLSEAHAGRFSSLFDLTHDNLLPPNTAGFLKADGVLGSLMFGAATGVSPSQLQQTRQEVGNALKAIVSSRAGRQELPYWQTRYREAAARNGDLVRFEHRATARGDHARLEEEVKQLDQKLRRLDAERHRLEALLASVGDVDQLSLHRLRLVGLAEAGEPPTPAVVAELSQHHQRVRDRASAVDEAQEALNAAVDECQAAEEPGALHALVARCEALREDVAACVADRQQLEKLRHQRVQKHSALAQVLERLGAAPGDDPENTGRALLRPEPLAAELSALIREGGALRVDVQQKQTLLAAARQSLEQVGSVPESDADTAIELLDAVRNRLDQACEAEARIDQLLAEQADATPLLQRHLAALRLSVQAGAAADLPLPPVDAVKTAEAQAAAARALLESRRTQWLALQSEAQALEQALAAARQRIGSVASASDVAAARALRDARLQALRESLNAGSVPVPEMVKQADELRQLVRQSDLLVDRRMEAGEALGRLQAEEQRAQALALKVDAAQSEMENADRAVAERERALVELWPFLREPPNSAAEWFRCYEDWRAASEAAQRRESELVRAESQRDSLRQDVLATLVPTLPRLRELASMQAVRDAVQRERELRVGRAARVEALRRQKSDAETAVRSAQVAAVAADAVLADWQVRWEETAGGLPDGLERQPEGVQRWLELQDALRRALAEVAQLQSELKDCSASIVEREARIDALLQEARTLDPNLALPAGLDPVAAYRLVDEACKSSASRLRSQEIVSKERDRAERDLGRATQAAAAARAILAQAWGAAGMQADCTSEALAEVKRRAEEAQELREQIGRGESALRARWGAAVPEAIEEVQRCGQAALEGRLEDVEAQLQQARSDRDAAADRRRDAQSAIDAMMQEHSVTQVAQELADAREGLFAKLEERYQLQVAAFLLDCAHREATDGGQAIEELGSEYFRALTGGAYGGLLIDHDAPGDPKLCAVESAPDKKDLDALSTGTRDQVWLALRLAGIVQAAKETPFPLLLDDSLVQFDDVRAEAALRLLHRISEHVQVILFTHHDHLAALAQSALPPEDLAIVPLPEVSGAMRIRAARREPAARIPRPVLEGAADPESYEESAPQERRGRRDASGGLEEAKQQILDVLHGADAPMGKAEILAAATDAGLDLEAGWTAAIRALVDEGVVIQEGQKRGARYQLR